MRTLLATTNSAIDLSVLSTDDQVKESASVSVSVFQVLLLLIHESERKTRKAISQNHGQSSRLKFSASLHQILQLQMSFFVNLITLLLLLFHQDCEKHCQQFKTVCVCLRTNLLLPL